MAKYNPNRQISQYYQTLIKNYGQREADKIWNRRNGSNAWNFDELGRKLSEYLNEDKMLR